MGIAKKRQSPKIHEINTNPGDKDHLRMLFPTRICGAEDTLLSEHKFSHNTCRYVIENGRIQIFSLYGYRGCVQMFELRAPEPNEVESTIYSVSFERGQNMFALKLEQEHGRVDELVANCAKPLLNIPLAQMRSETWTLPLFDFKAQRIPLNAVIGSLNSLLSPSSNHDLGVQVTVCPWGYK